MIAISNSTLILLLIILLWLLFCGLIFPTLAFLKCTAEKTLPNQQKVFWIGAILILWPVGSYLYAVYRPFGKYSRWIGILSLTSLLLGLTLLLVNAREIMNWLVQIAGDDALRDLLP